MRYLEQLFQKVRFSPCSFRCLQIFNLRRAVGQMIYSSSALMSLIIRMLFLLLGGLP
jgi:hypothetical protein